MRQSFVILLLASALASCGKGGPAPAASAAAASAARADAPTLLLGAADLLTVQTSTLASGPVISGSIQPARRADLRAEVAAVVVQVLKDNGDTVRAGDLLMRLDDTALRDNLGSAEEAVRAGSQTLDQAERQVERLKTLKQQGMISTQALEDVEIRRNIAQSELVAAKARVVTARQQMQRTQVRAPFDGVVSDRKASVGDTTQIGKELVKVIDPRSMRFEGLVSADRLHELKIGQKVQFRINGFSDVDFAGEVRRIDAAANPTTRQIELVIGFNDAAAAPRVSGPFAEGRIETGSSQALMVADQAVVRVGDNAHAWRLQGQSIQQVALKLGERDPRNGSLAVLDGLSAGDRILRNPGSTLVDGQKVEMAATAAAAVTATADAPAAASAAK
jgi:membrane fusion protein, multidrug efflux system